MKAGRGFSFIHNSLKVYFAISKVDCQRDLSISHEKDGDVLKAQADLAGALKRYRDSLAIREKLAKLDPNNTGWRHDLSISYDKVGDVMLMQGELQDALDTYLQSLEIRLTLAKQDESNADWLRDLIVSFVKVAKVSTIIGKDKLTQAQRFLAEMYSGDCTSPTSVDAFKDLKNLQSLNLSNCTSLTSVDALKYLVNLRALDLSGCAKLTSVDALKKLKNLQYLDLSDCTLLPIHAIKELRRLLRQTRIGL